MNPIDIRKSLDLDLAGSYAAMQRAARSAQDLAIKTNTSILVVVDGKNVHIPAAELIKMRESEGQSVIKRVTHPMDYLTLSPKNSLW